MKFTLTVKSDGDALTGDHGPDELALILRGVADKVENYFTSGTLLDSNGNPVGTWAMTSE